jgi:hypothetical protein
MKMTPRNRQLNPLLMQMIKEDQTMLSLIKNQNYHEDVIFVAITKKAE